MRKFFRNNGLTIVLLGFFLVFQIGLSLVGERHYNQEQREHGQPEITYSQYLFSSSFMEATMENWESEFLQMFAFVLLTVFLFQRGSTESKDPDKSSPVDREPSHHAQESNNKNIPGPVRKGGFALKLYENSLSLTLFVLFLISFWLHAVSGAGVYNEELRAHGGSAISSMQYLGTAQFWFESLQNWQSEFFSIGLLVVLTIFMRQKGSSQSKPVDSPHSMTGNG